MRETDRLLLLIDIFVDLQCFDSVERAAWIFMSSQRTWDHSVSVIKPNEQPLSYLKLCNQLLTPSFWCVSGNNKCLEKSYSIKDYITTLWKASDLTACVVISVSLLLRPLCAAWLCECYIMMERAWPDTHANRVHRWPIL